MNIYNRKDLDSIPFRKNYIPITGIVIYSDGDKTLGWSIVKDGKLHNLNGPAVIRRNGSLEYWINHIIIGYNLSKKEFHNKVKEIIFK